MRTKGKIASWDDDKGYGFIEPSSGGKQIFIHASALSNRNRRPQLNQVVTYSVSTDKRGRPCAANATLAGDRLVKRAPGKGNAAVMLFAVVFLAAVAVSTWVGNLSKAVLIDYIALSLASFFIYAYDKSAARRGAWRTSENTLLLLGLAGGWPGALIAQEALRHKSSKTSFRIVFWATVVMNCAALAWLHTASGKATAQSLLG